MAKSSLIKRNREWNITDLETDKDSIFFITINTNKHYKMVDEDLILRTGSECIENILFWQGEDKLSDLHFLFETLPITDGGEPIRHESITGYTMFRKVDLGYEKRVISGTERELVLPPKKRFKFKPVQERQWRTKTKINYGYEEKEKDELLPLIVSMKHHIAVEHGKKQGRAHLHIVIQLVHRSKVRINIEFLKAKFHECFSKIGIDSNPYVNVRAMNGSNAWNNAIQYIDKDLSQE